MASTRGRWATVAVGLAVAILALNILAVRFVAREQTILIADQVRWWAFARDFAEHLRDEPVVALQAAALDIARRDVSVLPAVPIAFAMLVLGTSRLAYLVATLDLYGGLAALALVLAVTRLGRGEEREHAAVLVAPALALGLLPGLWTPVFSGYLALGAIPLALAILLLYLRRPAHELPLGELAVIGFLLALLVLFRRWMACWSVGFLTVASLEALLAAARTRPRSLVATWQALRPALLTAASAAATLAVLAWPSVAAILGRDYADRFASYQVPMTVIGEARAALAAFGLLPLLVVAAATAALLACPPLRRTGLFVVLQAAVAWVLFRRIQAHGMHHWTIYLPGLLLLLGLGLDLLLRTAVQARRATVATIAALLAAVTTAHAAGVLRLPPAAAFLVPLERVEPARRGDLPEVRRLLAALDGLLARRPGYVYVLSCSPPLVEHTLAWANLSLGTSFAAPDRILAASHFDRRDGFPRTLLAADVVVVVEPFDCAQPEEQHVVLEPATSFAEWSGVAAAFLPTGDRFLFEGGVVAIIWIRARPSSAEEIADLSGRLRSAWPDRPEVWSP